MATAKERILIPELLALIILALPQSEILIVQRVSKAWKSIIEDTPDIQQKLFLQPSTRTIVWDGNPPFRDRQDGQHPMFFVFENGHHEHATLYRDGIVELSNWINEQHRASASWRRMLIRQPPLKELQVWLWVNGHAPGVVQNWTRETGVRFEDLIAEGIKLLTQIDRDVGRIIAFRTPERYASRSLVAEITQT